MGAVWPAAVAVDSALPARRAEPAREKTWQPGTLGMSFKFQNMYLYLYGTFARYGFTCLSLECIDYHRAGYTFVSTEHAEKARSPFSHSRTSVPSRKSQESLSQSVKIDRKGKQGTGAHMALLWGLSVYRNPSHHSRLSCHYCPQQSHSKMNPT